MKGIELPVNVLVMMVLAVVVLLGIIILVTSAMSQGGATATMQTAKDTTCIKLRMVGCKTEPADIKVTDIDVGGDGTANSDDDTLSALCNKFGVATDDACKELCGCK